MLNGPMYNAKGVKFFFKQWGGINKQKAGRTLKGQLYNEMRVTEDLEILPY